ncbi:hypothetical protein B481_2057 [Planococcus halocryophilus Or1]|nr:hypothetical protein B481_2057 [Planococcus halocryophilus Or1]
MGINEFIFALLGIIVGVVVGYFALKKQTIPILQALKTLRSKLSKMQNEKLKR